MTPLRIVFMGTGDIALDTFSSLHQLQQAEGGGAGLEVELLALVTQPDKPVGRKQVMTPPKIKPCAEQFGLPVYQPEKVRDDAFLAELRELKPDLLVVMAYGQILSQALLDIPKIAAINLHASLLPKYRGAACIQAAIDAGDQRTGVTVMHMVKALDAGDIILKHTIDIAPEETGGVLHDRLAAAAPAALAEALSALASGQASRTPQDQNEVSHVSKLMRSHGEIDWSMSAEAIERRVRAYDPWPGTATRFTDKKGRTRRLKIFPQVRVSQQAEHLDLKGRVAGEVLECSDRLIIACGDGALELEQVQPDGSRRMSIADFLLGDPLQVGDRLGQN